MTANIYTCLIPYGPWRHLKFGSSSWSRVQVWNKRWLSRKDQTQHQARFILRTIFTAFLSCFNLHLTCTYYYYYYRAILFVRVIYTMLCHNFAIFHFISTHASSLRLWIIIFSHHWKIYFFWLITYRIEIWTKKGDKWELQFPPSPRWCFPILYFASQHNGIQPTFIWTREKQGRHCLTESINDAPVWPKDFLLYIHDPRTESLTNETAVNEFTRVKCCATETVTSTQLKTFLWWTLAAKGKWCTSVTAL